MAGGSTLKNAVFRAMIFFVHSNLNEIQLLVSNDDNPVVDYLCINVSLGINNVWSPVVPKHVSETACRLSNTKPYLNQYVLSPNP